MLQRRDISLNISRNRSSSRLSAGCKRSAAVAETVTERRRGEWPVGAFRYLKYSIYLFKQKSVEAYVRGGQANPGLQAPRGAKEEKGIRPTCSAAAAGHRRAQQCSARGRPWRWWKDLPEAPQAGPPITWVASCAWDSLPRLAPFKRLARRRGADVRSQERAGRSA